MITTSSKNSSPIQLPSCTSGPYYSRATFNRFTPLALLYTAATQFVTLCLRPFPLFRLVPEPLLPEDCFQPPPAALIGNTGFSTNDDSKTAQGLQQQQQQQQQHIAIVTGSNTGIGYETAASLAERGYNVILACRSREKGEEAARQINSRVASAASAAAVVSTESSNGNSNNNNNKADIPSIRIKPGTAVFLHPLDLSSFASIKSFTEAFALQYDTLHILVNNAGINSTPGPTEDGYDACFQTNFLGHFLLTKLLLPHLLKAKNEYYHHDTTTTTTNKLNHDQNTLRTKKSEAGRIVNLSSVTHHFCSALEPRIRTNHDNLEDEKRKKKKTEIPGSGKHDEEFWLGSATYGVSNNVYRESKLASLLFTLELNKRYRKDGLRSVCVNPGSVNSDIWRNYPKFMKAIFKLVYLDNKQGSRTSLAAAIGKVPHDDDDDDANNDNNLVYLQPYWQPWFKQKHNHKKKRGEKQQQQEEEQQRKRPLSFRRSYGVPFPICEMLGPVVGHAITEPRLPNDGQKGELCSEALWNACEKMVNC